MGIVCVVADANDLSVEMVGRSPSVTLSDQQLALALRDNPAGQDDECTPLVLLRECTLNIENNSNTVVCPAVAL